MLKKNCFQSWRKQEQKLCNQLQYLRDWSSRSFICSSPLYSHSLFLPYHPYCLVFFSAMRRAATQGTFRELNRKTSLAQAILFLVKAGKSLGNIKCLPETSKKRGTWVRSSACLEVSATSLQMMAQTQSWSTNHFCKWHRLGLKNFPRWTELHSVNA